MDRDFFLKILVYNTPIFEIYFIPFLFLYFLFLKKIENRKVFFNRKAPERFIALSGRIPNARIRIPQDRPTDSPVPSLSLTAAWAPWPIPAPTGHPLPSFLLPPFLPRPDLLPKLAGRQPISPDPPPPTL